MSIIKYSTAFKALDNHIKNHNKDCECLAEKIRQSTTSTAKNIIKIYGLSLLKAGNLQIIDSNNPPSLRTNNAQLAKMGNASPRTIQRHIIKLMECGIITQKIWHGSNSSYELKVNSNILLIKSEQPINKSQNEEIRTTFQTPIKQETKNNITTNCPHTDTSNNSYINNIIIAVDNLKSQMSSLPLTKRNGSRNATSNILSGYTEEKSAKKLDDAEGKVRKERATIHTSAENSLENLARPAFLKPYVDALWKLARNTIYKEHYLTQSQVNQANELLYLWYQPVAEKDIARVHQVYVDRIEIVQKYLKKDPESRYVQLPNKYFDPKNKYGFAGTRSWYFKQKEQRQELKCKLILNAQIRTFLNNEKKETSKQKPRLELFRKCETRIGKLGKPALVDAFHASILEHSTYQFLH
ncbi:hypothetical protein [uncultured Algibacter sp.]|uniref:hypothetical protein n=1 Tax=uncultured Algibacter sp. TaxID=298659 RepID=UPI0032177E0C